MHLHGFYFSVDAVGDGQTSHRYTPEERRLAVTETVMPGHTFDLTWTPDRPGNWIFHCHILAHMSNYKPAFVYGPEGPPAIGYDDTPFLPDQKWRVHDNSRPHPTVVTPAKQPGAPPSDAIMLFDGKDFSGWHNFKREGARPGPVPAPRQPQSGPARRHPAIASSRILPRGRAPSG